MKEVEQGIPVPPLELVFPILYLRHAIHVVFGSSDLQSLTAGELSLVEDIMSEKFNFPLANEAKGLSQGAVSASQKKEKKRKMTMPDTRVVDNRPAVKLSLADPSVVLAVTLTGTPPAGASTDPSPTKSSIRTMSRSSETEGIVNVPLPTDGSTYSD